ncbi:hypothetical protein GCM10011574_19660 [Microbispora bryophytorum]|uniref:Uncharacterized protein n=1 Tax=Microbispora bryophytorum TaxID=1460882 RepID=A0A8H9GXC4_9ACTN|nr:hypothetical protein GCM10011574_19660 [Microbispora bryophytorum]
MCRADFTSVDFPPYPPKFRRQMVRTGPRRPNVQRNYSKESEPTTHVIRECPRRWLSEALRQLRAAMEAADSARAIAAPVAEAAAAGTATRRDDVSTAETSARGQMLSVA